jgi:L-alanine-DL-glutamate epimerase-like enolase superfamily enzyme
MSAAYITQIECFQVAWAPDGQFPAISAWVRVHDSQGRTGIGEASPMQNGEPSLSYLVRYVAPGLIGADPFDAAVIKRTALNQGQKLGPHGIVAGALAALDIALWDLKGQAAGLPIYKLLGGAWRTELPFYASLGGLGRLSVDQVLAVVDRRLQDGPALLKLRMEHTRGVKDADIAGDLAKARAVRAHVGDRVALAFDASNGYTVASAVKVGRALEDLGFDWFEEPVEHYHLAALEVVTSKLDIPVATGEQAYTLQDVLAQINAGVSIIQPDIIKMGGFTGLMDCKALAQAHGVELVPHQTQPVIGHLANLHFVAAQFQATRPCEVNDASDRQHAVVRNPPLPREGLYQLSARPGLGLEVDEQQLTARKRPISTA